jgi:hypothetical protein
MKKCLWLAGILLLGVLGGAWLLLTPGVPVKVGMTEKEVEEILSKDGLEIDAVHAVPPNKRQVWANFTDRTWYAIEFQNGRVVTVEYFSYEKTQWARFREWLGLAP